MNHPLREHSLSSSECALGRRFRTPTTPPPLPVDNEGKLRENHLMKNTAAWHMVALPHGRHAERPHDRGLRRHGSQPTRTTPVIAIGASSSGATPPTASPCRRDGAPGHVEVDDAPPHRGRAAGPARSRRRRGDVRAIEPSTALRMVEATRRVEVIEQSDRRHEAPPRRSADDTPTGSCPSTHLPRRPLLTPSTATAPAHARLVTEATSHPSSTATSTGRAPRTTAADDRASRWSAASPTRRSSPAAPCCS